ncbi:MAG TPA: trigger factor [Clostridia bacterium]|nr:trigger factor [Clostridia bacterium]
MSYTVEKLEKSQVKISFIIDAPTFEKAIEQAYQKTKGKFAIGGFRKGHAPRKVIEGIYGKEAFFEDAMDIVIPDAYGDVLDKEKELDVVARPELLGFDFTDDGGAKFELSVTVKPEVKLGNYKDLDVNKTVMDISEEQIAAEIELARDKQARMVDANRPAQNGDTLTIDFSGSVDGEKFEGGTAENYDLVLGSNSFIPGFEEQLIGLNVGDEKDVNVKFPEDYHAENLKGKDSVFACKVHAIKMKELPAVDDEFVKEISEFDTLDEYKADIERKLKEDAVKLADTKYENEIIEKVVTSSELEIPAAMIDMEAEDMVAEFEYRLSCQGIKLDDYLNYVKMKKEDMKAQYMEQADKAVRTRLVMEKIIIAEDLKISDDDMKVKIDKLVENSGKSAEEFKKTLKREQIDYIANQILSEKLMEQLKSLNPSK